MDKVMSIALFRAIAVWAIALVALVALMTAPAIAITGNWVPDTVHPFVGLVVIYDAEGNLLWRGSGSLISPTVVLTAGHVVGSFIETAGAPASARVYFQQDAGANTIRRKVLTPFRVIRVPVVSPLTIVQLWLAQLGRLS